MSSLGDETATTPSYPSVVIPTWGQGRPGLGQGGYTSAQFEAAVGQPITISLKAPIPLETELSVDAVEGGWELRQDDTVIMTAVPSEISYADTPAVGLDAAADARTRFPVSPDEHNARNCLSCGFGERTMEVWPGLLDDGTGRVASDWHPPAWAGDDNGLVDPGLIWMALDCTCGFYVGQYPERRNALTVQYAVEVLQPVQVGHSYVVVGFDGNWPGGWDGRKRGAGSCVFDADGAVVARSDSFWVSVPDPD